MFRRTQKMFVNHERVTNDLFECSPDIRSYFTVRKHTENATHLLQAIAITTKPFQKKIWVLMQWSKFVFSLHSFYDA